jgi:hypothetical protein
VLSETVLSETVLSETETHIMLLKASISFRGKNKTHELDDVNIPIEGFTTDRCSKCKDDQRVQSKSQPQSIQRPLGNCFTWML